MSKKLRVGIDIDSVLADLVTGCLRIINRDREFPYSYGDVDKWQWFKESLGVSHEEQTHIMFMAWQDWPYMRRMDLDFTGLGKLQKSGHDVTIITRREVNTHNFVTSWLNANRMDITYDSLVFCSDMPKLAYPIDILLDDSPTEAMKSREFVNKIHILRDQKWNADVGLHRVASVNDFARFVLEELDS